MDQISQKLEEFQFLRGLPPQPPYILTQKIKISLIVFLVQIYIYGPNFTKIGRISIFKGAVPHSPPTFSPRKLRLVSLCSSCIFTYMDQISPKSDVFQFLKGLPPIAPLHGHLGNYDQSHCVPRENLPIKSTFHENQMCFECSLIFGSSPPIAPLRGHLGN